MSDAERGQAERVAEESPQGLHESKLNGPGAAALFLSMRLAEAEDGLTPEETLGLSYLQALLADSI